MARIVSESYPDFVRIVLFIPAVELLGIQELFFIMVIFIVALFVSISPAVADSVSIGQYDYSLTTAITNIGSAKKKLYIDGDPTLPAIISGSTATVPSNISIIIEYPGSIDVNGKSLTINGPFSAGLHTVFTGTTGTVRFGTAGVKIQAVWFKDYTTDAGLSLNAAIASLKNGGEIELPAWDVTYETAINLTGSSLPPIKIVGQGKATTLRAAVSTVGIDTTGASDWVLRDFQLVGDTPAPEIGILMAKDNSAGQGGLRGRLYNIITDGSFNKAAIFNYASEENRFYDLCRFRL